jgi:hypothetical protein
MEKYFKAAVGTTRLAGTRSLSFATGWATRFLWGISSTGISNYPLWILINLRFSSTGEGRCCWAAPYDVRRNVVVVVVVEYRRLGREKEVGQQRPSRAREEPPELLRIGTPTAMMMGPLLIVSCPKRKIGSGRRSTNASKADAAANAGGGVSDANLKEAPHGEPVLLFALDDGRHGNDDDDDNDNGSTSDLVVATLVARPSQRNRSPYVADVYVPSLEREAICHVPNLDTGGKGRPGVQLLMKRTRDNKGRIVGPDATSLKFGTPKCERVHPPKLLHVDESAFSRSSSSSNLKGAYPPMWVGTHPSLGERITKVWIERNLVSQLADVSSPVSQVRSQESVSEVPGRRFDFMITHKDGTKRIAEV